MKKKLFASLLMLFLGGALTLMAQTRTVTGKVIDQTGQGVIAAGVQEKGTTNGAITDLDGNYTITVGDGAVLVFSSIGYATQEIPVSGRSVIDVTFEEDSEFLDEVVVVGYGTMKKSDLAGASVSMREEDLKGSIITNLDQSLQGRAAGVTAVQTSGAPGSSSSIRVRGQATINANAEPLYVIDGVIMQGGGSSGASFGLGDALGNGTVSTISPLSTINPADIVSMEILKDASATAIYGAQGANGVVLITTKHGKAGDAKFTYDGMVAAARQMTRVDIMNLREFAEYYNDLISLGEGSANDYYATPSLLGKGTNWQDAIFRTAFQQQHQISANGGTEKVQYYVSASWMDQDGTIIGSNFNRLSLRANLDAQLKNWFKLGYNLNFAKTRDDLKLADSEAGLIRYSLTTPPDIPIYDVYGNYSSTVREGYTSPNPVAMAMMEDNILDRLKLNGNVYGEITPFKHITWRTEVGFDVSTSDATRYRPLVDLGGWTRDTNTMSYQKNTNLFWQLKNYLTYTNAIGKHSFTAMLGQEAWESSWNYLGGSSNSLSSDEVHNVALGKASSFSISSGFGSAAMASFFTRETYNYDDRYLATYTFRYDGSSNFGPDNRWAGFHSLALAWRFSNEKFFEPLKGVINQGKLRLGWGQTGNANIGGYAWGSAISRMPSALGPGFRPANIANTGIRWESQNQWNVGLDLSFLESKINLTVDAYYKISDDMLMSLDLPSYMGTDGNGSSALAAPKGNYGSIENKGLEITLDTHPIDLKDFGWDSNFQISFNRNKLLGIKGAEATTLPGYGQWSDIVCMSEVGKSLYNFYGYVVEGVYTDLADIESSPRAAKYPTDGVFNRNNTVWVGDLKYKDISGPDGVPDGIIDENDQTDIGSPLPKFTFGWNNTFRYRNFDLNIFLNGSYGNKVLNYNAMSLTHMNTLWGNQLNSVADRAQLVPADGVYSDYWYDDIANVKVSNPSTKTPRPTLNDPNDNDRVSDRYVEDGSYLRIKNVALGYTFPKSVLSKVKIDNLRVYCNIQNLYTFTKYTGYDPEVGASTQDSSGLAYGVDNGRYPSPLLCSFGVNLTF